MEQPIPIVNDMASHDKEITDSVRTQYWKPLRGEKRVKRKNQRNEWRSSGLEEK